ncbi:MAG: alpha-L-arabinofuranosidase C-terminal domain-containing protein [Actinomycetota bacterium]
MLRGTVRATAAGLALSAVLAAYTAAAAPRAAGAPAVVPARLTVDLGQPGAAVSPLLYGIFFEEINRAGDGGVYAEMIQNRSFEDAEFPLAWTLVKAGAAEGGISLDQSRPLNGKNPTSLRLDITREGGRVGVATHGFRGVPQLPRDRPAEWRPKFERATGGIAVEAGKRYDLSLYARSGQGFAGPLTVSLEREDGSVLDSKRVKGTGAEWQRSTVTLTPRATEPAARLVISADQPGQVWLDMVSLFPRDTYKRRANGLRPDLMGMIERMHPRFVRFPGGCFVEGDHIGNAFRWKETIGDIAERRGHWNLWGYRSTDGLGYHEYLQMCEDLGAEPLFVANCGMSHQAGRLNAYAVPMAQMGEYVQDALDAIEYANGPATSKWGALRTRAGHPKPFNLKLLQIGNENGGPAYNERFALFHDAIKKQHPEIELVACDWGGVPRNRTLDIIDPHLYSDPETMRSQANRFDGYDRRGPQVYFGEYAVTTQAGAGNLQAAVAEAAFMTGLERNGDAVKMSSYAPLLSHISWKAWNPNAIVYDQSRVYGTPSYHVQALFAGNRADRILPLQVGQPQVPQETPRGIIGVGTWRTQAEFKDIRVTKNGQTLFASDFSKGHSGWKIPRGRWNVVDGALRQTSREEGARALIGDPSWSDYTLSLKARKLSGDEGFLITFQAPGDDSKTWWNLGGWENTLHGLELPGIPMERIPGRIETGRWYDIRVELQGLSVKCYLDGKLIQQGVRVTPPALFGVAGVDSKTGETILKVVNASGKPLETAVELLGARQTTLRGKALVLASTNPLDENSFEHPAKISPREEKLSVNGAGFSRTFPAYSVTVLRLRAGR